MHRRVAVGLLALLLVVGVTFAAVYAWRSLQRSSYEQAVLAMPGSTLRATYTDWSKVRAMAGGAKVAEGPTQARVDAFVLRAYDQDLTSTSALVDSTFAMADLYGFSALDASWEMFGQSEEGAVAVMRMPESVDLSAVEENLVDLGYAPPTGGAGSDGVYEGTADLVAQIDPSLTPVLQNLVVLRDERVVLMSDATSYAESSAEAVLGDAPSLVEETAGVEDLSELAADPVSAVLYASDFACEALSTATADEEDQVRAEQLVDQAGGVSPLAGLLLALEPDRSLQVGMYFESEDQAADDLEPRVELAAGEAVGQGGSFAERFQVASGEQSGQTIVLDLTPVAPRLDSFLLSDLSAGPLLFAAC